MIEACEEMARILKGYAYPLKQGGCNIDFTRGDTDEHLKRLVEQGKIDFYPSGQAHSSIFVSHELNKIFGEFAIPDKKVDEKVHQIEILGCEVEELHTPEKVWKWGDVTHIHFNCPLGTSRVRQIKIAKALSNETERG